MTVVVVTVMVKTGGGKCGRGSGGCGGGDGSGGWSCWFMVLVLVQVAGTSFRFLARRIVGQQTKVCVSLFPIALC